MRNNLMPEETAESLDTIKILQRAFKELTGYTKTSPQTAEDYKKLADLCVAESKGLLPFDDFLTTLYQNYCASLANLDHHDVALTAMQAAIDYYSQNPSTFLQTNDYRDFLEAKVKMEALVQQYQRNFTAAKKLFSLLVSRNPQYAGLRLDYAISLALANEVELALEQLTKAKQLFQFDIERTIQEIEEIEKHSPIGIHASKPEKTNPHLTTLQKLKFQVEQDKAALESLPKFEKNFQNADYINHIIREFGKRMPQVLQNPAAAKKFAHEGVQAYSKGKYEEATKLFDKALAETNDPKDAIKIYYNAGRAHQSLQNFSSACNRFSTAFSLSISPYQDLLKQAMKEVPQLNEQEKIIVKMVMLQMSDESCQNLKDRKSTIDMLCAHLRMWRYEPLAEIIKKGYELKVKTAVAITEAAKYFLVFSQMLRYLGNFTTSVEISRTFINCFEDETDPSDPDTLKILSQLEKDAEMAAKIIPIISTQQNQVDDDNLAVLQEYLRYEPNNPIVSSFCKFRSITLPSNSVQQVMNDFGNLATAAGSSTISFVLRTLQKKEQTEDSSSTPLQDLTTTAPAATPLGNPISLPK